MALVTCARVRLSQRTRTWTRGQPTPPRGCWTELLEPGNPGKAATSGVATVVNSGGFRLCNSGATLSRVVRVNSEGIGGLICYRLLRPA